MSGVRNAADGDGRMYEPNPDKSIIMGKVARVLLKLRDRGDGSAGACANDATGECGDREQADGRWNFSRVCSPGKSSFMKVKKIQPNPIKFIVRL